MAKIHQMSPQIMRPHPLLERVGMMRGLSEAYAKKAKKAGKNRVENSETAEQLAADWIAFLDSIREVGILEPLKVCRDLSAPDGERWFVVDGRNRWTGAMELDFRTVPVIRVAPEDAQQIIAATVAARRHYTKGATAYLAILLNPAVALEGELRKKTSRMSRTECATSEAPQKCVTLDELAARFAVSPRLMDQAADLYRLLVKNPRLAGDAETEVWAGSGLGGIIAGVRSLIETGKRDGKEQSAEYKAASAAWGAVTKFESACKATWERWEALDAERRASALETVKSALAEAPAAIREELRNAL